MLSNEKREVPPHRVRLLAIIDRVHRHVFEPSARVRCRTGCPQRRERHGRVEQGFRHPAVDVNVRDSVRPDPRNSHGRTVGKPQRRPGRIEDDLRSAFYMRTARSRDKGVDDGPDVSTQ